MNVLIACEFSGIVREAFKNRGHNAWSCDLLPTEIPGNHHQGDIKNIMHNVPFTLPDGSYSLLIPSNENKYNPRVNSSA